MDTGQCICTGVSDFVVTFAGRLVAKKGVATLIDAITPAEAAVI